ncbi:MAG: ABC transporter permease [Planctomycetes bacterium]|nr:ABC transporter permease [Planctomycetota bacterium]
MRLLWRQGLRHHARHPLQTLLTLLGIAAGAALLCAMQLAQRSAEQAFDRALETIAGRATHVVTGGPDGLPVDGYRELRARLGGRGTAPAITAVVRVRDRGERLVLRAVGIDPFADAELRPWAAVGGGPVAPLPVGPLLTTPGGFVATEPLLRRLGIGVGATVPLSVAGRPVLAVCVGIVQPPPLVREGLADVLLVDVATAQEWTGRLDRVERLDLFLPDAAQVERALAAVRDVFGAAARIEPAGRSRGGLAGLARGFRVNLTALSLLSLLVGAFLVHETMRLSVVARRAQFGVLRALGAPGHRLGVAVAVESAVLGACGSGLGALLGVLAAHALLEPLVRSLNDHYATFSVAALEVDPWTIAATALLGTAVAVVAGLGPARAAARVSPREVLVTARAGGQGRGWSPWAALPPLLAGAALLATVGTRLVQAYAGLLCVLIAAVLLVPHALGLLVGFAARAVVRAGPFVRYVARSTAAAKGHLALPVAAMVLAVATTIGIATLVTSFRDSVAGWLGQVLPADVYVSVPGGVDERGATIDPAIVQQLLGAPEVAATSTYRRRAVRLRAGSGDGEIDVVGVLATPRLLAAWPLLAGDDSNGRAALAAANGCWISEPLAFRWGIGIGDRVAFATARGEVSLPVAATYRDYSKERGEVIVGDAWCREQLGTGITALGFEVRADADPTAVAAALRARAAAAGDQAVLVQATRDIRGASLQIFDRTFAITGVMRLLCLAVAFFGIYAAFAALQLERGREVGLLRTLGARPLHIGTVVLGQTALLGVVTGVLALPLGIVLGHLLAHVVNRVSFGWSLVTVDVPGAAIVEALLLAVTAALLAGVQPALRFARMRPVEVLREA